MRDEHLNLAASIQSVLNTVALHCASCLADYTKASTLLLAGGVALNSSMNGYLARSGLFPTVRPHPSASDRGNALGALFYHLAHELNEPEFLERPIIYGGAEYSVRSLGNALGASGLRHERPDDIAAAVDAGRPLADRRPRLSKQRRRLKKRRL